MNNEKKKPAITELSQEQLAQVTGGGGEAVINNGGGVFQMSRCPPKDGTITNPNIPIILPELPGILGR